MKNKLIIISITCFTVWFNYSKNPLGFIDVAVFVAVCSFFVIGEIQHLKEEIRKPKED
jgi:hypothetical protein